MCLGLGLPAELKSLELRLFLMSGPSKLATGLDAVLRELHISLMQVDARQPRARLLMNAAGACFAEPRILFLPSKLASSAETLFQAHAAAPAAKAKPGSLSRKSIHLARTAHVAKSGSNAYNSGEGACAFA